MPSLKQDLASIATAFAQFFRQRTLLVGVSLLSIAATWGLSGALDRSLARGLCGKGPYEGSREGGCSAQVAPSQRVVRVPEMQMPVSRADFDARHVAGHVLRTVGFWADSYEIWSEDAALGYRARRLSLPEARAVCEARHGRLPSSEEWVLLASSSKRARYPWGDTGLLCRTATWGRLHGPCAHQGSETEADAPGAHPDGCTSEGVCDLVGNRAEWSEDGVLHGGSYASTFAGELRVWATETPGTDTTPAHAGARCVYDSKP